MSDQDQEDDGLLSISLGPDNYASTAAADNPVISPNDHEHVENPRTHQSEAAFAYIKAGYTAKISSGVPGALYKELLAAVPALKPASHSTSKVKNGTDGGDREDGEGVKSDGVGVGKVKLSKREQALLGYVVGEMYYDRHYTRIVELCARVGAVCVLDKRLAGLLEKWRGRALEREMEKAREWRVER